MRHHGAVPFFDAFAEHFDTFYDAKRNPIMRRIDQAFRADIFIRFERTFEAFGDLAGQRVLDLGCGSGPYVVEAFRRGAHTVTAFDPAPAMLDLVRQRLAVTPYAGRCTYVEGAFPDDPPPPHDHVIVMGVMDYVAEAAAFLAALRPLVRRSAAVSFPSEHWFRTPLRKLRYRLRNCPVYFYNEPGIRALCTGAGFAGVDLYKIPGSGLDYHVCLTP